MLSGSASVCPSVRLSVCPSVRLSVCPSVRLSVCPSACLSVCARVRACKSFLGWLTVHKLFAVGFAKDAYVLTTHYVYDGLHAIHCCAYKSDSLLLEISLLAAFVG